MLILSPRKKEKFESKEPENRQNLNYARSLFLHWQKVEPLNKYLHHLRSLWAETILSTKDHSVISQESKVRTSEILRHPFRLSHPLIEVISHLLIQTKGESPPPLRKELEIIPIGELCQLALLQSFAGHDGQSLGRRILPFCSFPTLWCSESDYDVKETQYSIALLQNAFGRKVPLPENRDPYFQALAKHLPAWDEVEESQERLPAVLETGAGMKAALVQRGIGVPLGSLYSFTEEASQEPASSFLKLGVKVPAFGPQVQPLNEPKLFGIYRNVADSRYSAVFANKEVWFETNAALDKREIETRFTGLSQEKPISFVFYIKAEIAKIQDEIFLPKSLRRYNGEVKRAVFERKGSSLSIENTGSFKMELIPLAGGGCFWDSDFLLSFEIPFHDGRALFRFS